MGVKAGFILSQQLVESPSAKNALCCCWNHWPTSADIASSFSNLLFLGSFFRDWTQECHRERSGIWRIL